MKLPRKTKKAVNKMLRGKNVSSRERKKALPYLIKKSISVLTSALNSNQDFEKARDFMIRHVFNSFGIDPFLVNLKEEQSINIPMRGHPVYVPYLRDLCDNADQKVTVMKPASSQITVSDINIENFKIKAGKK